MTGKSSRTIFTIPAILAGALAAVAMAACTSPLSSTPRGGTGDPIAPIPAELAVQDFSGVPDGTPLADYGYTVDDNAAGTPSFVIAGGVIQSDNEGGWFNFLTPEFAIALADEAGTDVYTFLFKPYLRTGEAAFNLEVSNAAGSLLQVARRTIDPSFTPTGAGAPWIDFRWELSDSGDVRLLIDGVQFMQLSDASFSQFSQVHFTYRTSAEPKNYLIQLRNLSMLPLS